MRFRCFDRSRPTPFLFAAASFLVAPRVGNAACIVADLRPTTVLPTITTGQTFSFLATNDCSTVRFRVSRSTLTKIPTAGARVGLYSRRYSVALTASEWDSVTGPLVTTFEWAVTGATTGGVVTRVTMTNELDLDGDGWPRAGADPDCDDDDAVKHPRAAEVVANGVDEDCSGGDLCWEDDDDDGYLDTAGDTVVSADADCTDSYEGSGTDPTTDCNDQDNAIHPAVAEVCDAFNVDEDCDGLADDGDAGVDASGGTLYYADVDDDGYGDRSDAGTRFCDDPSSGSYASRRGDCDDSSDVVSPGAVETCLDGVDNDCDRDAATCSLLAAQAKLEGVTAGDQAGLAVAAAGDVDGDGHADLLVGAPNRDGGRGSGYLVRGPVSGTFDLSAADAEFVGKNIGDAAAAAVSGAGDLDGDGNDDMLIGAIGDDGGGTYAGAVYVIFGPASGAIDLSTADAELTGEAERDNAGSSIAALGDVDSDGHDDIVVGAEGDDTGGAEAGAVYLVLGPVTGSVDLSLAEAKLTGEHVEDLLGTGVAGPGDVDGDGVADVLLGAWAEDTAGVFTGAAYLILGPVSGTHDVSIAEAMLTGESTYDLAGESVSGAGDVDADGHDDILVGAYRDDDGGSDAGAAYLLLGPVSGSMSLSLADAKFVGEDSTDFVGTSVSQVGDVNGDSRADLLIGARNESSAAGYAGAAYVVLGPVTGTFDLSLADAKMTGEDSSAYAGGSVAGVGDENGDGFDDVMVGASGEGDAGAAYLVLGGVW